MLRLLAALGVLAAGAATMEAAPGMWLYRTSGAFSGKGSAAAVSKAGADPANAGFPGQASVSVKWLSSLTGVGLSLAYGLRRKHLL